MVKRGDSAEYALSNEDAQKLLSACTTLEEKFVIGGQIFLGLRAAELAHLNSQWVTSEGNIKVPTFMTCHCVYCERRGGEWRPKTKAGARVLPIPRQLQAVFSKFLELSPDGLGYSRIGVYFKTKRVLVRAKIRRTGLAKNVPFPHALRATCASILARGGMDAMALCAFMGWENIAIGANYIKTATARDSAIAQAKAIFG